MQQMSDRLYNIIVYICGVDSLDILSILVHRCYVVCNADCCFTFHGEASEKPDNSQTGEADKAVQKQKVSSLHFDDYLFIYLVFIYLLFIYCFLFS